MFKANRETTCIYCKSIVKVGDAISWRRSTGETWHYACKAPAPAAVTVEPIDIDVDIRNGNAWPKRDEKALAVADALQALLSAPKIDESIVRRIASEEAAKVSSAVARSLEIKIDGAPAVKFETAHKELPKLLKLAAVRDHNGYRWPVSLYGPPGSGKSHAARQVADALTGGKYGYLAGNPMLPESRVLGFMSPDGRFVETEFYRAYTLGGTFCLDEADNLSAQFQAMLNGAIANGKCPFAVGMTDRHPDFVLIVTANTNGLGPTAQFPERRPMDGPFRDRFNWLAWEYDDALTSALVESILGDKSKAAALMQWVSQEGNELSSRYPSAVTVSPRTHISAALMERNGFHRNDIREIAIAKGVES